ncbi:MAG: NAD(P)H-dependent glycerol-3-phosphate dehydrogenase [Pseudomonadota bacterium]
MTRLAVIGAGAWGTAIAHTMAANGHETVLWGRNTETVKAIQGEHKNRHYIGEIALSDQLRATNNLAEAIDGAKYVFLATPAQTNPAMAKVVYETGIAPNATIICCAKGLDQTTGLRVSQSVSNALWQNPIMVLSGPSFADDLASGLPTAVTLAGQSLEASLEACQALSSKTLRLYASDDLIGVELGGALKNVMAIAAGMVDGAGLGASAKAALVTRGFAEMVQLASAAGADPSTLNGLSGLGDLILTCSSPQSRNYSYGRNLAQGHGDKAGKLAEGVFTAKSACAMAERIGIEAPIMKAVANVLSGRQNIDQAVESLMTRPVKAELA